MRPKLYNGAEEMQRLIDLYFLACKVHQTGETCRLSDLPEEDLLIINDIDDVIPTISGLAYTLGMTTETLRMYGSNDEFSATVKRAKQRIEKYLEQRLDGQSVTGTIFNLKNNFGWKDQSELAHTGKDGGPIQSKWTVEFVNATPEG